MHVQEHEVDPLITQCADRIRTGFFVGSSLAIGALAQALFTGAGLRDDTDVDLHDIAYVLRRLIKHGAVEWGILSYKGMGKPTRSETWGPEDPLLTDVACWNMGGKKK